MTKHQIEFCAINLGTHAIEKVKNIIEKEPDVEVTTYSCLKNCYFCFKEEYARVNGEIVKGKSAEGLLENIYQQLGKEPVHSKE